VDTEAVRRAVAVGLSTLCVLSCGRVNETAGSYQLSERFCDVTVTLTTTTPRVLIATRGDEGSGFDAQFHGRVEYVERRDCFVLADTFGGEVLRYAVAWPPGTTAGLRAGRPTITVPGFGVIEEGDWLLGPGYYEHPDRGLPDLPAERRPDVDEFVISYGVSEVGAEPLTD